MKKNGIHIQIFLFCFLILNSCFNPDSVNYVAVNPETTKPNVVLNLNYPGDTIVITKDCNLYFTYSTGDKDLNWAEIFIDSSQYFFSMTEQGRLEVRMPSNDLTEGVHSLEILIFTNSKTGSIADKEHAEGFLFTRNWVLIYIKTTDISTNIISARLDNGFMKIVWSQSKPEFVKSYKIQKKFDNGGWQDLGFVSDPNQTWFLDSNYIGESAAYKVVCLTTYGADIESQIYQSNKQLPKFYNGSKGEIGEITLSWDKTLFPSAFQAYRISSQLSDTKYITDINNCSVIFTGIKLGGEYSFTMTMVAKNRDKSFVDTDQNFTQNQYLSAGESAPVPTGIGATYSDVIYYRSYKTLFKYDPAKNRIVDSVINLFSMNSAVSYSPNAKYFFESYSVDNRFAFSDLQNTNYASNYDFYSTFGHNIFSLKSSVSDNGILALVGNDSLYLFDLLRNKLLTSLICDNISDIRISPKGEYIVLNRSGLCSLYHYDYKLNRIKWTNSDTVINAYKFEFLPDENDKFWYDESHNKAHILKLSNMQEITSYQFSTDPVSFDLQDHRVLVETTPANYSIIDLLTGSTIKDNITGISSSIGDGIYLWNNYIYWEQGFRIKVD